MAATNGEKPLELSVRNFGPIAEADIELRPLSVFVGPSNTGKSYLATLIYALHRFFSGYAGEINYIGHYGGNNRMYSMMPETVPDLSKGEIAALLNWARETHPNLESQRHIALQLPQCEIAGAVATSVRQVLGKVHEFGDEATTELCRCFGIGRVEELESLSYVGDSKSRFTLRRSAKHPAAKGRSFGYDGTLTDRGVTMAADIATDVPLLTGGSGAFRIPLRNFSWPDIFDESEAGRAHAATGLLELLSRETVTVIVSPLTSPMHYLPASRSGIMQSHRISVQGLIARAAYMAPETNTMTPVISGVMADFLSKLVALADSIHPRNMNTTFEERGSYTDLATHLERDVLRGSVKVSRTEIAYPTFTYQSDVYQRDLPLMNASSMVSELAPVVLYLRHVVQPGDTLIIEEPESHLHPTMQVKLTRLLAAVVKAGIRIIITTHSEWILEELANLVLMSELPEERREGLEGADLALSPEELGVWSFQPTADGSMVEELRFDEEAGKFPSDAGLVTVELYNRFTRIANRIERLKED